MRHFEDIADEILPPNTLDGAHGGDIFDFLQVLLYLLCQHILCATCQLTGGHVVKQTARLEQLQRGADPANMPTKADTPNSLVRRYEVCIIPLSATKARKLREIKSGGTTRYLQICVPWPKCNNSVYETKKPLKRTNFVRYWTLGESERHGDACFGCEAADHRVHIHV